MYNSTHFHLSFRKGQSIKCKRPKPIQLPGPVSTNILIKTIKKKKKEEENHSPNQDKRYSYKITKLAYYKCERS